MAEFGVEQLMLFGALALEHPADLLARRADGEQQVVVGYRAFDAQPGDRLYLPPEQRVRIW